MKSKFQKFAVLGIVLLLLFSVSCSKVENKLEGTWTGSEMYEDGVLSQFNDLFKTSKLQLDEEGTGTLSSAFGEQPLTWSYDKSNEILTTITTEVDIGDGVTMLGITTVATITKIDGANLWLEYTDDGVKVEARYTK